MSIDQDYRTVKKLLVVSVLLLLCTVGLVLVGVWTVFVQESPSHLLGRAPKKVVPAVLVTPRGDLAISEKTTIEIFERVAPSVVFITKLAVRHDPFRRNYTTIPKGTGSGFMWDRAGHIVTNYHVIQGGNAARVTLSDRSVWAAELVGYYDDKDLAVLRIDAPVEQLHPLAIGSSNDLVVGQHAFAIGNPFGLDHTLSTGVVSGLGREIPAITGRPIQGAIQTDAAINPGNSGGPLLDSAGRLIGINTQIFSPSGTSAGVGFAVPVDTVKRIVPQLIEHGRVIRAGLGVKVDEGAWSKRAGIKGALVLDVIPGSSAEKVGIKPTMLDRSTGQILLGDLIVSIDDKAIHEANDLFRVLDTHEVGQTVSVVILRGEKQIKFSIKLMPIEER
ncbi:MAG: trypsin-like peptidase domain-containing protein [Myxococcales bacterium]|nr:MAG: trypsin-like peptidase domain-containing protein [Myxococcales bacterium]